MGQPLVEQMQRDGLPVMGFTTTAASKPLIIDCLLYTSDAADERSSVDLGGRRIIKKKKRGRYGSNTAREYLS